MAESPADRRERIAEALYVMMVGHCATGDMLWSADLCAQKAREWAATFVAGSPEHQQPTPDGYPTLLEAAKALLVAIDTTKGTNFAIVMLRDAIEREEARRE